MDASASAWSKSTRIVAYRDAREAATSGALRQGGLEIMMGKRHLR